MVEGAAVPLPRGLTHFNRRATNRLTGPLASRLPGFGVVVHTGRASGRRYRTPVNVFRTADSVAIALTCGPEAQWVRNVLANGGALVSTGGRTWRLIRPQLAHDEGRRLVPAPVRLVRRLIGVADFLALSAEAASPGQRSV
jgi:deazaflavin-dependent oxidoreductase (nitroreductase family)